MKQPAKVSFVGIVLAVLAAIFYPQFTGGDPAGTAPAAKAATPSPFAHVGFTSERSWREHFAKHGAEFGDLDAEDYLRLAQALRDAPLSRDVVEGVRQDAVICRFDRKGGGFLAFHEDRTIRTFFRPNDGEAYFRRQLDRVPEGGR